MIDGIKAEKLCSHCNKTMAIELHHGGHNKAIANHQECEHCGKRNDMWIQIEVTEV